MSQNILLTLWWEGVECCNNKKGSSSTSRSRSVVPNVFEVVIHHIAYILTKNDYGQFISVYGLNCTSPKIDL